MRVVFVMFKKDVSLALATLTYWPSSSLDLYLLCWPFFHVEMSVDLIVVHLYGSVQSLNCQTFYQLKKYIFLAVTNFKFTLS